MKVTDIKNIIHPLETPSGEVIYELIGRNQASGEISSHSLAKIVLPPGKSSSTHYHQVSEETYYILQGEGQLQINELKLTLISGQACLIQPGEIHRIVNQGELDLVFLAICVPAWVPEDSFEV